MARLVFFPGDTLTLGSSTSTDVIGSSGKDTLTVLAGSKATLFGFDANDAISLSGNASSYSASISGSSIVLTDASGGSVTIPVSTTAKSIAFADATRSLAYSTASGKYTLGDQVITATTATVTEGSGGGAAGQTFTLTEGVDDVPGTAGDDTINGVISDAQSTLNLADTVAGGDGTDTLSVVIGDGANATTLNNATISGVEVFKVRATDTDAGDEFSQNFALFTGETSFINNISTGAVTVTNLAADTSVTIVGNGGATNGATSIDYVAAATSSALTVSSGVTAGAVTITGDGLESQTISSTGAANTIGALTLAVTTTALTIDAATKLTTGAITGAALEEITITGAGAVDVDAAALPTTVRTVDASAAAGVVSVKAGAVTEATDPSTVDIADVTISTGSANDAVDVSSVNTARELSVSTGAGDDTITIGSALVSSSATNAGDVIDGGEGTDALKMTSAIAAAQASAVTTVSGIEQITISDALAGALVTARFQAGINTVNLAAGANAGTITFGAGSNVVNIAASLAGQLTLNDTGTATTDSVTINNTATVADDMGDGKALVVGGFETVNIVTTGAGAAESQDFGAITVTGDTGGATAVNFSGENSVTAGVITAHTVDASGLEGTAKLTMGAAMVGKASGVNTLTGSAGDDTLIGDAGDTTNIDGGAGDDDITGGTDFETINGGDGDDTISGGGGADTLNGDAGDDEITLGSTTASADGGDGDDTVTASTNLTFGTTVVGGAGTDTLSVDFGTAVSAANGSVVSGFETLTVAGTGNTVALANFGNNTFTQVNVGALAATTITGVTSQKINLTGVITGDLTVTLASATGTSDAATIAVTSASATTQTAAGEVVLAGVETVNLEMVDTDTTAHVNTLGLKADSATTINVTGNAGLVIGAGAGTDIADVITFDASGVVLAEVTDTGVTYAATYNVVGGVTTITGSNGVDILTGGIKTNDTISGGSGADTIVYTGGADSFTGGEGDDTFDVNAVSTTSGLVIADATAGDILDLADLLGTAANIDYTAAQFDAQEIVLGSAATLANYLDSAAAGDGSTNEVISWFNYGGNTYVVVDNTAGATFTAATDSVIVLTGTIDLSTSSVTDGVLTFA